MEKTLDIPRQDGMHPQGCGKRGVVFLGADEVGTLTDSVNPADYFKKMCKRDLELT